MAELGVGYLSIIPETSKIAPGIKSALGGAEKHAEPSGKSMGSRIAGGIGSAVSTGLKTVAGGAVAAGVAGIGTAMVKGFQRLDAIDNANAKLTGLGHSASSVQSIMDDSLASVKGTAFGLGEAASLAAGAVASGIKPGQELQRVLSLTGDAATIAGTSMGEMGSIFNKVAATNKVQGDVLNQLGERGIPIIQMLAAEMGVTAEEAVKMASAGEIGFETFANAMESQLGGAALEGAKTVSGALANLGAAAGRLGAEILGPGFASAPALIGRATEAIDGLTAKAGPAAAKIADLVGEMDFSAVGEHVGSVFSELAATVSSSGLLSGLGSVATSVGAVASAAASASPAIVSIAGSLAEVGSSIGVSGLSLLATTLDGVAAVASGVLAPALATVAGLMESQTGLVTAAVVAWGAFKTVPSIMSRLQQATAPAAGALQTMTTANGALVQSTQMGTVQMGRFGSAIASLGERVPVVAQMQTSFVNAAVGAERFGRTAGVASAAMTGIRAGATSLVNALGGPLNAGLVGVTVAITAMASASQTAQRHQDALRESSERLAESQRDVTAALIESSGELSSEVWSELSSQIGDARKTVDELVATKPGLMDWGGALLSDLAPIGQAYTVMTEGVSGLTASQFRQMQAANETAKENEKVKDVLDGLGLTNEQLAARVYGSGTAWGHLKSQIDTTSEGGQQALTYLGGLREEFQQQQAMVERIGPEYFELQGALGVLGDAAASADDKLSAMRTTLEILGVINTSAAERTAEVAKAVGNLGDVIAGTTVGVDEFDRAFQNADGTLNTLNENTHGLFDALDGISTKMQSVASAGGDVEGTFAALQPELEAARVQAEAMGIDWAGLLRQFGLTPESIETMVRVTGLDEVQNDLITVSDHLKDVEAGATVEVKLLGGEDSVAEIERLGGMVEWIDEAEGYANVTVESQGALEKLQNTKGLLGDIDETTSMATLLVDGLQAERGISEILADLDALDDEHVSPEVALIIDEFMAGRDLSHQELDILKDRVADPKARLLIDELLAASATANADLDNTARPRTATITPVLAAGSLGSIQAALNSMSFTAPVTGTLSSFAGRNAAGGRIPRRAEGGRLPTTGPGTDRTDGILGVSSKTGQPTSFVDAGEWVINGESSEDYDGVLGMINRDDPRVRHLKAFQQGGRVGRATKQDLLDLAWGRTGEGPPLEGDPYRYGQIKWGDCSSAQYAFAAKAVGLPPFGARFSTSTMSSELRRMGATMGSLGGDNDYNVGWYGHGTTGHTVGAIGRTNVEMGGGYGGGKIGGTANPWQSIYTQKAHIPLAQASGSVSAATGAGTSGTVEREPERTDYSRGSDVDRMDAPRSWSDVAGIAAKSAAEGYTSDLLSLFGLGDELPPALRAAQEWKASERARAERIADRDEAYSPGGGASGSGSGGARQYSTSSGGGDRDVGDPGGKPATGWGDMVTQALDFVGLGEGLKTKVLGKIDDISGGDPDYVATAPWTEALARHSSGQGIDMALAESTARGVFSALEQGAAMGLMGITAGEFSRYRDSELPDDEFHPMANVVARLNEAIATYGSIEKAWASAPGYWNGGTVRDSRDVLPAWLAPGEEVTRTADAQRGGNRDVLQAMRNGATFSADAPGPEVHNHYHVSDVDGALRRQRIHEGEQALTVTGGGPIW